MVVLITCTPAQELQLNPFQHISCNMGENDDEKYSQAGQIFENFIQASTCKGTIQAFNILTRQLELDPLDNRNFYTKLKSRVTTWKAKALWNKLDKRASHKEYKRGKSCMNTKVSGEVQFSFHGLESFKLVFLQKQSLYHHMQCNFPFNVLFETGWYQLILTNFQIFLFCKFCGNTASKTGPKSTLLYNLPQSWQKSSLPSLDIDVNPV